MISHKHKFIFIHIPKTGGTSIEVIFDPNAGTPRIDSSGKSSTAGGYITDKHISAYDAMNKFPYEWKTYFTFTVVRNPWSWLVSRYFWSRDIQKVLNEHCTTFDKFIHRLGDNKQISTIDYINEVALQPQITKISDLHENVIVDFCGRYENLQNDFNIICDKIGISQQKLPHKNKSKHKHYTEYYNEETKQIVAEKYAKDIEYFGYKFGE